MWCWDRSVTLAAFAKCLWRNSSSINWHKQSITISLQSTTFSHHFLSNFSLIFTILQLIFWGSHNMTILHHYCCVQGACTIIQSWFYCTKNWNQKHRFPVTKPQKYVWAYFSWKIPLRSHKIIHRSDEVQLINVWFTREQFVF